MIDAERPPATVPAWVRVFDALALLALVAATFVLLFGGFVAMFGLSVRSPFHLLFIAAALIAIRHAAHPAFPLHRRAIDWLRSARGASPWALAVGALASRIAVLFVGYFAVLTLGLLTPAIGFEVSPDPLLNLPARFDAGWYGDIAEGGYYFQGRFDRQQNVAFFPAFPLLMRAGGYLVGGFQTGVPRLARLGRLLWVGVVISIVGFIWAAHYLARLARDTIGDDRAPAAVALLAAYPFAVFFSAPYTEGLFLLGAIGAFYHFRRREWGRSAIWGLLVGLTRPNGGLVSLALACLLIERHAYDDATGDRPGAAADTGATRRALFCALAVAAPLLGLLLYGAYVHQLTGAWFGWARLHGAWGRSFSGLDPVIRALVRIENDGLLHAFAGVPFDTLNALALIFSVGMLWAVFRRVGPGAAVFVVVSVLPPFLAGGVLSMGRVTSTLFPVFLALAAVVPRRGVLPLVTAFALAQGLMTCLFFTWRAIF